MQAVAPRMRHKFRRGRLVELRKQRGWSETELAAKAGVTAPAIRKWENGAATPKLLPYLDLCVALGVDFEELIEPA